MSLSISLFSSPCQSTCSDHTKFSMVPGTKHVCSRISGLGWNAILLDLHISTFIQQRFMKLPLCAGTVLGFGVTIVKVADSAFSQDPCSSQ